MRIGIDLGGTKIELVALGPDGDVIWRERVPTPKDSFVSAAAFPRAG